MSNIVNPLGQPTKGAPDIVKPSGEPAKPEAEQEIDFASLTPADRIAFTIYNEINDDMRAVLSAGIALVARLTVTGNSTLHISIEPECPVRIDHEKKLVYRLEPKKQDAEEKDSAPSEVPTEQGQPADDAGAEQAPERTEERDSEDGEKA